MLESTLSKAPKKTHWKQISSPNLNIITIFLEFKECLQQQQQQRNRKQ